MKVFVRVWDSDVVFLKDIWRRCCERLQLFPCLEYSDASDGSRLHHRQTTLFTLFILAPAWWWHSHRCKVTWCMAACPLGDRNIHWTGYESGPLIIPYSQVWVHLLLITFSLSWGNGFNCSVSRWDLFVQMFQFSRKQPKLVCNWSRLGSLLVVQVLNLFSTHATDAFAECVQFDRNLSKSI